MGLVPNFDTYTYEFGVQRKEGEMGQDFSEPQGGHKHGVIE